MSTDHITLFRLETRGHAGPFNGGLPYTEKREYKAREHLAPVEMYLDAETQAAVNTHDFLYFFTDFASLLRTFTLLKEDSIFRVVTVDVPLRHERTLMFFLEGKQAILDSDTYLNWAEQGLVRESELLTELLIDY